MVTDAVDPSRADPAATDGAYVTLSQTPEPDMDDSGEIFISLVRQAKGRLAEDWLGENAPRREELVGELAAVAKGLSTAPRRRPAGTRPAALQPAKPKRKS